MHSKYCNCERPLPCIHCSCGAQLPIAPSLHIYKCECGKLWIKPDCSDECEDWKAL